MDNTIFYTAKFTHHDLKFHKVGGNRTKDVEIGVGGGGGGDAHVENTCMTASFHWFGPTKIV
jgi:hypothetical protein